MVEFAELEKQKRITQKYEGIYLLGRIAAMDAVESITKHNNQSNSISGFNE